MVAELPAPAEFTSRLRYTGSPLAGIGTSATPGMRAKPSDEQHARAAAKLEDLQERLFAAAVAGAEDSVLLVLQGMDSAGKGGVVRHVMGQLDPAGVAHAAFGKPTQRELAHDFLWRIRPHLPRAGRIAVFDRSHYEDVLVPVVAGTLDSWDADERYEKIRMFERQAIASGTRILKVFLHLGRDEQRERLLARLDDRRKQWKFTPADVEARADWPAYQGAYERAIAATDADDAPWFIVPADHKWYARVAVQQLLLGALEAIDPHWPSPSYDVEDARRRLLAT